MVCDCFLLLAKLTPVWAPPRATPLYCPYYLLSIIFTVTFNRFIVHIFYCISLVPNTLTVKEILQHSALPRDGHLAVLILNTGGFPASFSIRVHRLGLHSLGREQSTRREMLSPCSPWGSQLTKLLADLSQTVLALLNSWSPRSLQQDVITAQEW